MQDEVENIRNKLNFEIRSLLSVIDLIDGKTREYENYIPDTLNEEGYLYQQLSLVEEAKKRLTDIFKD